MDVIRFEDIVPSWNLPRAKEPEYNRKYWKFINPVEDSDHTGVSLMHLPVGSRSFGRHHHAIEETYFVIDGKAGVWCNDIEEEIILEKFDCAIFSSNEKHSYRCVGDSDLFMLSIHCGLEDHFKEDNGMQDEERYTPEDIG